MVTDREIQFYREENFKRVVGDGSGFEVPENWEVVELDKVVKKIKPGGTPKTSIKKYYENGSIPFVKIEDITAAKKYLKDTKLKITELGLNNSNAWLVPPNSLLFAMYGSIGAIAINKIPVATNQAILGIVTEPTKSDLEFLYYTLLFFAPSLHRQAKQTTQANLTAKIVKTFKIPLPPLEEQQKIAHVLMSIDKAIEVVDEAIAKAERIKKGLMQELLTKGIGHTEFKDTEIGRIPKEWEVVRLESIVEIYDSKRIPLSEQERAKRRGPYPYCGATGIIDYIDDYIFDGEYVLLAEDGGYFGPFEQSAYIMSGKFWVNNHAHILRAKDGVSDNWYLMYVLNYMDLRPYIVGSTRTKLNQEYMRKIKIPLPPLEEQQKIAKILSKWDEVIEMKKAKKDKLERMKKKVMELLLTGKVRVK